MARAFSVAALAIAEGGANAVGAVRFTCAETELEVELVRVAGYAEGFALGAVAAPVRFGVPYTAIRGTPPAGVRMTARGACPRRSTCPAG